MKFDLKKPCTNCPFRKDSRKRWLSKARAQDLVSTVILGDDSFTCHKTVNYEAWNKQDDDTEYQPNGEEQFCAGALHLEHKCNTGGNLTIRIARMMKLFEYENLKAGELVFDTAAEFINHHT